MDMLGDALDNVDRGCAVSISASRYCDTLSRQQRSRRYFLCSREDDVML